MSDTNYKHKSGQKGPGSYTKVSGELKDKYCYSPAENPNYNYRENIVKDIDVTNIAPIPKAEKSMKENY